MHRHATARWLTGALLGFFMALPGCGHSALSVAPTGQSSDTNPVASPTPTASPSPNCTAATPYPGVPAKRLAYLLGLGQDLLGRTFSPAEVTALSAALTSENDTNLRRQAAFTVLGGNEYLQNQVGAIFQSFLLRAPTSAELTPLLQSASQSAAAEVTNTVYIVGAIEGIIGTVAAVEANSVFFLNLGSDIAKWISGIYQVNLGRLPTAQEQTDAVNYYQNLVSNGGKLTPDWGRIWTATYLSELDTYRTAVLDRLAAKALGRQLTADEIKALLAQMKQTSKPLLYTQSVVLSGTEYYNLQPARFSLTGCP